ncbi:MAG: hypothetical protein R3F59_38095, partial [Myxococcota bacterium]
SLGVREAAHAVFRADPLATGVGLGVTYAVAVFVTPPLALAHEEWHLAALREGGVTGTDRFWQGEVVDVADQELVRFKATDPAGLVRAQAAGLELQDTVVRRLSDDAFLYAPDAAHLGPLDLMGTWTAPHLQYAELNSWNYLRFCSSGQTDDVVAYVEGVEGGPRDRDFTGPDCTAWVRDLLRPDEPYAARGPHASGTGIGRYVAFADLTPDEQALLRTQTRLHWLELANPHLFGVDRIRLGDASVTASLQHWLTPYGYAVDLHGGLRPAHGPATLVTLRAGVSDGQLQPAVEARLVDLALTDALSLDAGLEAWLQPQALRWGAPSRPGGRLSLQASWRTGRLAPWIGVDAKSAGWSPGLAALDPAVYLRAGATAWLGRPAAP